MNPSLTGTRGNCYLLHVGATCDCRIMVLPQPSKLVMRVRFPSVAFTYQLHTSGSAESLLEKVKPPDRKAAIIPPAVLS